MSLEHFFIPAARFGSRRLLVVMHGLGDSAEGYRWMPEVLGFESMNYLLVNAPDPYYGGFSWYDLFGDSGPGVSRSFEEMSRLLGRQEEGGFPPELTTIFGFSQGCLMAMELAMRYPRKFAGVVGVSGYVHDVDRAVGELATVAREQRILFTHGTHDPVVPSEPVAAQVARLQGSGMRIEWRVFAKGHEIAGASEMKLIREFIQAGYTCESGEKERF